MKPWSTGGCRAKNKQTKNLICTWKVSGNWNRANNYSGKLLKCLFFTMAQQPPMGQGLLNHEVSRSHTTTPHSLEDSSGRVISPTQRPLSDKTQYSQQTDIHAPGGIRTPNPSKRAAADPRLRPPGHWDWHLVVVKVEIAAV